MFTRRNDMESQTGQKSSTRLQELVFSKKPGRTAEVI